MSLATQFHDGALQFAPGHIILPTGGLWAYVHASGAGALDRLPPGMQDPPLGFFTSVASAAAATRATRGDAILALPGHTETIAAADGWPVAAGVQIIGLGTGTARPTITLSAAASDLTLNDANTVIDNFRFIHSTTNVTKAFEVSAAGVQIKNCYIQASDGSNKMTTVMRLSSGADDFLMDGCEIIGGATALTDTCLINAAVARARIVNCRMAAKLGTTEGLITMATAAPTDLIIEGCTLENRVTNSTVALKGIASATGAVINTRLGVTVADGAGVAAAAFNTKGNLACFNVRAATITLSDTIVAAATQ